MIGENKDIKILVYIPEPPTQIKTSKLRRQAYRTTSS